MMLRELVVYFYTKGFLINYYYLLFIRYIGKYPPHLSLTLLTTLKNKNNSYYVFICMEKCCFWRNRE